MGCLTSYVLLLRPPTPFHAWLYFAILPQLALFGERWRGGRMETRSFIVSSLSVCSFVIHSSSLFFRSSHCVKFEIISGRDADWRDTAE